MTEESHSLRTASLEEEGGLFDIMNVPPTLDGQVRMTYSRGELHSQRWKEGMALGFPWSGTRSDPGLENI